ncbi:aspartate aminotransferase family protein [Acidisphaera sp. L21]|uniref:aspartate aminotransferase family protein n=1 Tax=Acidisphaera sp. L21 TaxID=1641851 RepID=UPI00131C494E|nr:aminotransferase class III-fold pyridoxal phosphate-dependent enzyme [Acidisphaera sp. L21]
MSETALRNATLLSVFEQGTPGSRKLAEEARTLLPSGLAHDSRHFDPWPIYVNRAKGPVKWDVDGNRYVDYFGGHGALILGHGHPAVLQAVHAQLDSGTHYGACHELELRWASLIRQLVPSIERLRFTSSGTEATLMALRLARAFTGRSKLLRIRGHFHGWHDHMTSGYTSHFDGSPTTGVLEDVAGNVVLIDPNDAEAAERAFAEHSIAAAIFEPTGANFGRMPLRPAFVRRMRELATAAGALLIFDEVVTGFRVSPGGAQTAMDVTPDLTTLAKIVAGGLPGGAVGGRKDILDMLDFGVTKAAGREKIGHPGTYNANPLSAAAGITTLEIIADGKANQRANSYGESLRAAMNDVLEEEGVRWAVHGSYSGFHIATVDPGTRPHDFDAEAAIPAMLGPKQSGPLVNRTRMGMLNHGVDMTPALGGTISAMHGDEEMAITVSAFRQTLRDLRDEGMLG